MINIPKGTKDVLPQESYKWHYVENIARKVTENFGYREIRTPVFEHTELFLRGVGDTTDIVNKEMYTFNDKGGRSISLKPEGTAGVARSFVENSLINAPQPSKMYYLTPVFRYEKPQAGRLREHHQFGIELYGSESPYADAEVILLAKEFFDRLGLKKLSLNINSIGCRECRKEYSEALKNYLYASKEKLCGTCLERLEKNPLRVLDCKNFECKEVSENAPKVLDYLCGGCRKHHEVLCKTLDELGVAFTVNSNIVRGLDYYTKTVFEFISNEIGSQGTVCGGGRYNNLVEEIGGKLVLLPERIPEISYRCSRSIPYGRIPAPDIIGCTGSRNIFLLPCQATHSQSEKKTVESIGNRIRNKIPDIENRLSISLQQGFSVCTEHAAYLPFK